MQIAVGFPTGRGRASFRDKGTEIPSLSRDKGTTGQNQNSTKGRDGPGQPVKIQDGMVQDCSQPCSTVQKVWTKIIRKISNRGQTVCCHVFVQYIALTI